MKDTKSIFYKRSLFRRTAQTLETCTFEFHITAHDHSLYFAVSAEHKLRDVVDAHGVGRLRRSTGGEDVELGDVGVYYLGGGRVHRVLRVDVSADGRP